MKKKYPSNDLTSPNLGSRTSVGRGLASVGVNRDSRVALGRVSGNGSKVVTAWNAGTATSDLDLSALGVELRCIGLVEGDDFVADEVVARGKSGGDGGFPVQVPSTKSVQWSKRKKISVRT